MDRRRTDGPTCIVSLTSSLTSYLYFCHLEIDLTSVKLIDNEYGVQKAKY